jgi:putative ABC transport system permease protein
MNIIEILRFAIRGLTTNKLRSGLTTLGITIGVGAVILLVAVGSGASAAVERNIAGLGTNVLTVTPLRAGGANGAATTRPLTVQDASALVDPLGAPDIAAASPVVSASVTAVYGGASHDIPQFTGTYPAYFVTTNSPLATGSAFTDDDVKQGRKIVVLGATAAQDLFGTADPIGQPVLVNSIQFTVSGVLASKGANGLQNADDSAVAPLSAVQNSVTGYGALNQVVVQAKSADSIAAAPTGSRTSASSTPRSCSPRAPRPPRRSPCCWPRWPRSPWW